ncbi:NUDIX domain-containing protein [Planococcus beigongshangi]|uniref:NUDIX domain-containing protein n=1 Tax=Planococcus beigongshangi TaxID=2782536 RepID=UPI00193B5885|nr:NUDIX hydrolase [Planococcus beigongshangi]
MNKTQNNGFEFLEFIVVGEEGMEGYKNLAGSFAVISCDGGVLMVYNKWREQWELPAGKREEGETAKECAVRELYEETGQYISNLEFKGLLKLWKISDGRIKYNPVYAGNIEELRPFLNNDEASEMKLWDRSNSLGVIDEMDLKLLGFI